jgi:hypothetical protein
VAARRRRYNRFLGLPILRLVLVLHALAVLAQSVFAGQFLSGSDSQVKFHEVTGWIVLGISAAQILTAALLLNPRIASLWLLFGSVFIFLAEGLQIGSGYARFLDVHVPLGVIIFAAVSGQAISVFLKRAPAPAKPNAT